MSWIRGKRIISRLLIVKLILALGLFTLYPLEVDGQRVRVRGYYRKDGTYVRPHYRTAPDGNPYNNYPYPGNYNPNTGKITTGDPLKYLEGYDSGQSDQTYNSQTQIKIPNGIVENDGYFTVGSTMNEVVAVQGTPDSFSEYSFKYG